MLEIIYRIYEVADEETAAKNGEKDLEFGLYSSTSKAENIELLMDCLICDSREQFKEIIRSQYGEKIAFRYSKWYYKIIDPNDSETEFYVSVDLPIKEEKVCSFLGLDGFSAKMITKDEYEQNTDDET